MESSSEDESRVENRESGDTMPKRCPDCPTSELSEQKARAIAEKAAYRRLRKIKKLSDLLMKTNKLASAVTVFLKPSVESDAPLLQINAANHVKKLNDFNNTMPDALTEWTVNVQGVLLDF